MRFCRTCVIPLMKGIVVSMNHDGKKLPKTSVYLTFKTTLNDETAVPYLLEGDAVPTFSALLVAATNET